MIEKNKIERVWLIKDNKLMNERKVVSKITYDGVEFAILKEDKKKRSAEMLIKDKNLYWKLNLAPIEFDRFERVEKRYSNSRR